MLIYGINPVLEAVRAGRVNSLRVSPRADERLTEVVREAEKRGIAIRRVAADELERAAQGGRHQGVVADAAESEAVSLDDLVAGAKAAPLIIVLDGIEDPQNLGAILRTADPASTAADGAHTPPSA